MRDHPAAGTTESEISCGQRQNFDTDRPQRPYDMSHNTIHLSDLFFLFVIFVTLADNVVSIISCSNVCRLAAKCPLACSTSVGRYYCPG